MTPQEIANMPGVGVDGIGVTGSATPGAENTYEKAKEAIYQQLKGQAQNLGTTKSFETGAARPSEGGLGSTDAVLRDMADKLAGAGLTSIEQFGVRDTTIQTEDRYNEQGNIEQPGATYTVPEYYNKATGESLKSLTGYDGRGWSGTSAGDGQTIYDVQFDAATGLPIFFNTQKKGRDDYTDLLRFAAIGTAIFAPQIGAALAPGATAATQLAIGSAVSGFVGSGGDLEAGIKAGLAGYLGGQAGSWAQGASNSALVGNIASNMTRAAILGGDMEQALVSSLVQAAPAEIIKHVPNFAQLPRAAQEAAVAATVDLMRTGGDNLGQIAVSGVAKGATDYALSNIDGYKDLRPAQQEIVRTRVSNVLQGGDLSNELLQGAIGFGSEAVQNEVNNEKAKKAGWTDYATQQAAKSLYGDKVTPDLYADKQTTTEDEAKQIARDVLGREPTEFEWMPLVGLSESAAAQNSDLQTTRYNESTFDSNELAQAYKDVYGKEPTAEWLASEEAINMLGRSDAQAKNLLNEYYVNDKNTTTGTEAQALWEKMGNTGPIPEQDLFNMLSMSQPSAETYALDKATLAATTFDGSGYADPKAAADAAQKAGFNTFSMADGQTFTVLSPVKEGEIKDEISKKQSFGEAFAEARQKLGAGKTFEWEGKLYTTDVAAANKAAPFDGSRAATKEDAAKLAVANGKLTFTHGGKTYGLDMQTASTIANSQNKSEAETKRLLAQAIKPATNESLAETQRLLSAGKPGVLDTVNSMAAQALGTTQRGLGQFISNIGTTYAQITGDTSYTNALTRAGADIEEYAKGNDIYGLGVQKNRIMQAVKQSEASPNFWEKVKVIGSAMAKNPLGSFDIIGSEAIEEIPETVAQIATAVMTGGGSLSAQAGMKVMTALSLTGSFVESFGASGKEAYQLSKARGDSDEVALNKSYINATLGFLAEAPGDFLADKALIAPVMKNFAEKTFANIGVGYITNTTAGAASELVSGTLQSYATQMVVDPSKADWSKAVSNGVFEMYIGAAVQTALATPGAVVDTGRVIGRDYLGNDVTLQQVIDGGSSIDLGSVSSNMPLAIIPDGGVYTVGSSIVAGEDLGVDYKTALTLLPENLTGANSVVAFDEDGTPVTLAELLDVRAKDGGDRGAYTDYLNDIFANPSLITEQPTTPAPDITDVVDKTPALPDQASSMKTAFEQELEKVVSYGYRNEDAIAEAINRTADTLGILPVQVTGTIGTTQDQLFVDYLDQVNVAPAEPEAPVTPPTTPPATGGEVVAVDPEEGTALVIDGNGNATVVDNADGLLAPGDTVPTTPTAPVSPPTQTQPETGGGTQVGGVDFAEPTDNVVDPTLGDLLSGIGESSTANLPAVINQPGLTASPDAALSGLKGSGLSFNAETPPGLTAQTGVSVITAVDPINAWAISVDDNSNLNVIPNPDNSLSVGDVIPNTPTTAAPSTPTQVVPTTPTEVAPSMPTEVAPSTPSQVAPSTPSQVAPSTPTYTVVSANPGDRYVMVREEGTSNYTFVENKGAPVSVGEAVDIKQNPNGSITIVEQPTVAPETTVPTEVAPSTPTQVAPIAPTDVAPVIPTDPAAPTAPSPAAPTAPVYNAPIYYAPVYAGPSPAEIERQRREQEKVRAAMQGTQSLMGMVPQMYKAAEEITTPIYSTMDYYDPFTDPFQETNMRIASTTVPTKQTKMAQGGYLDDLLAENMSVDDLLNLLR